ncbi:MAG: hypothetical protein NT062_20480, partial [Proteobacteria bacterium]|nr:hypothetical protein [Pseudomonadota bacterium]
VAQQLAIRLAIGNATFVVGDALDHDWAAYDAIYLFNPFAEETATFSGSVVAARHKLEGVRAGTRVVLYHGFGGTLPPSFTRVSRTSAGTDVLQLWVKMG